MIYIYKGSKPYTYHDECIVTIGDIFEVMKERAILNITQSNKFHKLIPEVIEEILSESEEYDIDDDFDPEFEGVNPKDYTKNLTGGTIINFYAKNKDKIHKLVELGVLSVEDSSRCFNVGDSNYAEQLIQPWTIWAAYKLNPWDADIIKRVLRTKTIPGVSPTDSRKEDYKKIIHVCQERLRQLDFE